MPKMYEALADAFLADGVDTQFVLMGDGNMHWSTAFAKLPGVHTVHVRHEHATVAAATAYNVAHRQVAGAFGTLRPGGCAPPCQWWCSRASRRSTPSSTTSTSTRRPW